VQSIATTRIPPTSLINDDDESSGGSQIDCGDKNDGCSFDHVGDFSFSISAPFQPLQIPRCAVNCHKTIGLIPFRV
jgi:hypothetical protein